MKKVILTISAFAFLAVAQSQTVYDVNRFISKDLNGTARFVGMGGAMGALGGDISTIGTNPAGIGIYRSSDVMFSFGFNRTNAESKSNAATINVGKTVGSFDNAGFVYSSKVGNKTALRYVNFGFNYHKSKSFNKQMVMGGYLSEGVSQTNQMASMAEGLHPNNLTNRGAWSDHNVGWLSILGQRGNLMQYDEQKKEFYGFPSSTEPYGDYESVERGGINQYDFNLSFNFNDRFYLGLTVGAYDVDYSRNSWYREGFDYINGYDNSFYTLENWFSTTGAGVDFKLGAIVRPFADSPFRIGAAFHTPTFYNLKDYHSAILRSDVDLNHDGNITPNEQFDVDTYNEAGEVLNEYKLITPWKFNFSLGHTIGTNIALGAEYEYTDYSKARLEDYDGRRMSFENEEIGYCLQGAHAIRLGLEYKPIPEFAMRLGYNHLTPSIKNDSFKNLPGNSIRTDTEYGNIKSTNNFTVGMGYRGRMFYADLAYQYKAYKEDFYAFDNLDLTSTNINNDRHQLLMTLGLRF